MRKSAILLTVAIMFVNSTAYAEVRKNYYSSGQLQEEANYKDGKQEGINKIYYESGRLQAEANYKDGKQEGIAKAYYESGKVEGEANFMNGVMISQKKYNSEGSLESEQDYPTE